MYIPFNETSIDKDFVDNLSFQDTNHIISEFISIIKESRDKKIIDGIILDSSTILECIPFFNNWLSDTKVNREDRMTLRTLIGCFFSQTEEPLSETKVSYNDKQYSSKGAALAIDTKCNYILNCQTNEFWKQKNNRFFGNTINEEGELISFNKELIQLFDINSLNSIKLTNKFIAYSKISSGQDLWEQWDNLFPNLIKCNNVKHCLYDNPERNHIQKIIEQLDLLQQYFAALHGSFSLNELKKIGMDVSDESDSVKNNSKLSEQRLFTLPDVSRDYFYYHVKFFGKFETRLHFLPIPNSSKCYVGYIGKHLKTQMY